jgi:hypothetical protein
VVAVRVPGNEEDRHFGPNYLSLLFGERDNCGSRPFRPGDIAIRSRSMTDSSHSLGRQIAGLAGAAFRSFVATFAVVLLLGIILASISFAYVNRHSTGYALFAAGLAIAEAVAAGMYLAGQRAVLSAAVCGLETYRLGGSIVRMIFDRIAGSEGAVASGLNRLPLSQAEGLLHRALESVMGDREAGSGLQRKLHGRVVSLLGKYTLARFRTEGTEHGGIDVPKLREELERNVDAVLANKIRSARLVPTLIVSLGLPLLVAAQTWAILRWIPPANSIPADARRILENADSFELLSLDPEAGIRGEKFVQSFHERKILGSVKIDDPQVIRSLILAIDEGLEGSRMYAACFLPRHGIRARRSGRTAELLICFECYQLLSFVDGEKRKELSISASPALFNRVLTEAGVPLPTEPE